MNKSIKLLCNKKNVMWASCIVLLTVADLAIADGNNLGNMASSITGTFKSVTRLVTAGSYLAGLAFSISAIMKFKQHKDNPTQIPIGTPISLVFIAAGLLFLPSILNVAGFTMFGVGGGSVGGPSGVIYGK